MSSERDAESTTDLPILSASESTSSLPKPASRYTTKRPHRKSRAGCALCKLRKIKCDEAHPRCSPCKKRNNQCSFTPKLPVTAAPTNALVPSSSLNSTDLRLMHHFATCTAKTMSVNRPGMEKLFAKEIPFLAFEHDFLLHCILSVSSMHVERLTPRNPLFDPKSTVVHRLATVSGLRKALTNLSPSNSEAVLLTSLFLLIVGTIDSSSSGDGESWITTWLGLHMGMRAIIDNIHWKAVRMLTIGPIFSRGKEPTALPVKLPLLLWEMLNSWDNKKLDLQVLCSSVLSLGSLYALLSAEGPKSPEFFLKTASWPASLPSEFAPLAREMRPEALVILAYYLALSKVATLPTWWNERTSDRGIRAIVNVLDGRFSALMEMPMQMVLIDDPDEMVALLLSQLPEDHEENVEVGGVLYHMPS